MADFYPPGRADVPDLLGSFYRGAMAPGMLQEQQQHLAAGQLGMEQLRLAMQIQRSRLGAYQQFMGGLEGVPAAPQGSGAQSAPASTGGIQNGPQAAVASAPEAPTGPPSSGSPLEPFLQPGFLAGATRMAVGDAILTGKSPLEPVKQAVDTQAAILADQQNRLKLQLEPKIAELEALRTSSNPERLLMNNPDYMDGWRRIAPQLGIDPADPKQMTPNNVRAVATLAHNHIAAASRGAIAPIAMPHQQILIPGANGQLLSQDPVTGETKEVVSQKLPSYAMEHTGYNPATGKETGQMIMTSPGGAPAPIGGMAGAGGAPRNGGGGGVGGLVGGSIDLGYAKPGPEAPRQAAFAESMRNSVATLRGLEQRGIALTPTQRTQVIKIATDEGGNALSQWAQQQALKKNLGPDAQAYLAAMMPVIQAVSHDQGGARLNQSQIRTNLESVIPVDVKNAKAMEQINSTRDTFYKSMAYGAGALAHAPGFQQTVGADLDRMRSGPPAPPKVGDVVKGHRYMGGPPSSPSSWSKVGG